MPRKPTSQRHSVTVSVKNQLQLSKAGSALIFDVRDDGRRIGQIEIGRGSAIWWPRNAQIGKRVNWQNFAKAMEEAAGTKVRLK
jgi:hypothetical protein